MSFDLSMLGVEQNIPKVNFLEYTGIFEAPEKFGKTAFSALYPNAILLAAERGYSAQVINKRDINKWDDLVKFIDLLAKHREQIGNSVQTIIIDTVDELYPMAAEYVVKRQAIKDKAVYNEIKDIPFGQGWNYHDQEFKKQIKRILSMGFTILYLTHSTVKQIKPKNGEPYDVYKSTMSDRCASIVYPACDYIIHGERRKIEVEEGKYEMKRVLTVKGSDDAVAGNRVYFDDDVIFDSEEEAMEKFQAKFREGIERNIRKAGIKTDLAKLEKQQQKEKEEQVKRYIEQEEKPLQDAQNAEELKEKIKTVLLELDQELKSKEVTPKFKEILGKADFTKVEDAAALQKALDYVESLK